MFINILKWGWQKISSYVVGTGILAMASFFVIAIATYDRYDPSFNQITHEGKISNYAGVHGAYIADPVLQSLGYTAILPIAFLLILGLKILLNKPVKFLYLKVCVLFFAIPLLALALAVVGNWTLDRNSLGGIIGSFLYNEIISQIPMEKAAAPIIILAIVLSILSLQVSLAEVKSGFLIILTNLVLLGRSLAWMIRVIYKLITSVVLRRKQAEEQDLERSDVEVSLSVTKSKVEIVDKPKSSETKVRHQSKLKLDPEEFELPSTALLKEVTDKSRKSQLSDSALSQNSKLLHKVLEDFGIKGEMIKIHPGPVVTLYEFEPVAGTKSSRVIGLADDIARSMSAISARIAIVPGKSSIGIELPNAQREIVYLREVLESASYQNYDGSLPLILGKNIAGEPVIADLAKMPHLLVAGTTGSGKSVAINTMILSLLYKYSPKQCKFIMIDPKMLELSVYEGIPHLLTSVVTDPKKAVVALKWAVKEMENRYRMMAHFGVRNIEGYNKLIEDNIKNGKKMERQIQVGFDVETGMPRYETINFDNTALPLIVVVVDEMADLMLVAGKEIEGSIQRLAQMARAAGIHLIMATQRPSVDVITGVIKANFPTRISFQVTSKIDSRTILGEQGAEQLLGKGDMLYMRGGGRVERVHGPYVDDKEVESITNFIKSQGRPNYIDDITAEEDEAESSFDSEGEGGDLYDRAVKIVLKDRKASTSYVQRCLRIGYNRAANLIERMEKEGIISAPNHVGKRDIMIEEE